MELRGKIVYLVAFEWHESQLSALYIWRNSESFRNLCSTRRNTITREEFLEELHFDFHRDRVDQFLIHEAESGLAVGTIYAYNLNKTDGHVYATIYLAREFENQGYGIEAFQLFGFYLFQHYDLHKLYVEAYEYNSHSLHCLKKGGFVEEGRFREHRLVNGTRHDLIRLAFFKKQLPKI